MAGPLVVGRHGVVIGAPPQEVFNYLADMARHGEWNGEPSFWPSGNHEVRLPVPLAVAGHVGQEDGSA